MDFTYHCPECDWFTESEKDLDLHEYIVHHWKPEPEPDTKEVTPMYDNDNAGAVQKPAISREDYDRGRAVLDALEPGYYVKCFGCKKWHTGGNFIVKTDGTGPYCEGCK